MKCIRIRICLNGGWGSDILNFSFLIVFFGFFLFFEKFWLFLSYVFECSCYFLNLPTVFHWKNRRRNVRQNLQDETGFQSVREGNNHNSPAFISARPETKIVLQNVAKIINPSVHFQNQNS